MKELKSDTNNICSLQKNNRDLQGKTAGDNLVNFQMHILSVFYKILDGTQLHVLFGIYFSLFNDAL